MPSHSCLCHCHHSCIIAHASPGKNESLFYRLCCTALHTGLQENTCSKTQMPLSLQKQCCSLAKLHFRACVEPVSGRTELPAIAKVKLPPFMQEEAVPVHLPLSREQDGLNLDKVQISPWV